MRVRIIEVMGLKICPKHLLRISTSSLNVARLARAQIVRFTPLSRALITALDNVLDVDEITFLLACLKMRGRLPAFSAAQDDRSCLRAALALRGP